MSPSVIEHNQLMEEQTTEILHDGTMKTCSSKIQSNLPINKSPNLY